MTLPLFDWVEPKPIPINIDRELADFSPVFRSVLFQRNFCTEEDTKTFLLPTEPDWYFSQQLLHTEIACKVIQYSIENSESIAVFGDYDADGITSTALLSLALLKITNKVFPYIPDRLTEGYGLNKPALSSLFDQGVRLVITVDNGIRSVKEVKYANSLGMKVIVTDHHAPEYRLPPAAAILNPKLPTDSYPDKNLAGVGVAYKLISALSNHFPEIVPADYLDLVAIGSIADVVPLIGENRYLVRKGLGALNSSRRQGISSLLGAANLVSKNIRSSDISFQIGPLLNASGRLGSADIPLDLLLSSNLAQCGKLAQILEVQNFKRKKLSKDIERQSDILITMDDPLPSILIAIDPSFHLGVAGIAAGSLTRKYYLPSIVGNIGPELTTASCRSIPEFNIISALDQCKDLLLRYGGHSLAAGFTISNANLNDFNKRMMILAEKQLSGLEIQPSISVDAEVSLTQLNSELYSELEMLEPTGCQNPAAILLTKNLSASKIKVIGQDKSHLKMVVTDGDYSLDAIGFGLGYLAESIPPRFDAVYKFDLNEFRGVKTFQLKILDLKST
jgi:single-stranded-DNA-specific exonuclease